MKWIYDSSPHKINLSEDQVKYITKVRYGNQCTTPAGILKIIAKQLGIPHIRFVQKAELVLQIKAIRMNNIWYKVSLIDESDKGELIENGN